MTEVLRHAQTAWIDEDQRLFFKYNNIDTRGVSKDEGLDRLLFTETFERPKDREHSKLSVLLHGSYECNLQCIYCENQHLRSEYHGAFISDEVIKQLVGKLGTHIGHVLWHGGEPLLIPERTLTLLEDEKKKHNLTFATGLQTNGLLLTKEKVKWLDEMGFSYGTSFDGLDNDNSRGPVSTKEMLRYISEFPDRANFIVVRHNQTKGSMIENYQYVKSLGAKCFQSSVVRENAIENDNPFIIANDEIIEELVTYFTYWMYDTDHPIRDSYLARLIEKVLSESSCCEDVYCPNAWIVMDPFGNITLCGHYGLEDKICNIKDIQNYYDLYYHPKYLDKLYKQKRLLQSCRDTCKWSYSCNGGCMGANYEYNKNYAEPNPRLCEYTIGLMERIYELIKDIDIEDVHRYNPLFLDVLRRHNYYSLTEIKQIEARLSKEYAILKQLSEE